MLDRNRNLVVGLVVVAAVVLVLYALTPRIRRALGVSGAERFANGGGAVGNGPLTMKTPGSNGSQGGSAMHAAGTVARADPHVVGSSSSLAPPALLAPSPAPKASGLEGFADFNSTGDMMGPVPMGATAQPQGCYAREQINPSELLPQDSNGAWAAANPQGSGNIQGQNFLSAGALTGVNTVGQSMRNPNLGLRAEPPCPQVKVSPWGQSTIEPDLQRRPLE